MTQQASLVAVHEGFGALARRHRSASGLTQEELAGRAGLSVRAIAGIERGRTARPCLGSVRLLADALDLSDATVRRSPAAAVRGAPRRARALVALPPSTRALTL